MSHTIDDDEDNVLSEPAIMYVGGDEVADIKVKLASGDVVTIVNYNRSQVFLILKVYATGTAVTLRKRKN